MHPPAGLRLRLHLMLLLLLPPALASLRVARGSEQRADAITPICRVGELAGGNMFSANMSIAGATAWCSNKSACAGFDALGAFPATCSAINASSTVFAVRFKDPWGARRPNKDAKWTNWLVPGPRPPPPPPPPIPIPPNPCGSNVTDAPRFHITNMGTGPHDINSIFYYRGVYHIMHQANWTDWAHLVSTDFARWTRLPSALSPNGDWDGALTFVDGKPVIMFDCYNVPDCRPATRQGANASATAASGRYGAGDPAIVGVARPADPTDPNLTKWSKDPANPIVVHGTRGGFQGPSTLWKVGDVYNVLMAVGKGTGRYTTTDPTLHEWNLTNASFYPTTSGACIFLPLPNVTRLSGTRLSAPGGATHVLASIDPSRIAQKQHPYGTSYYVLGRYGDDTGEFMPTTAALPLDSSDMVIFAQLHWDEFQSRMLWIGWMDPGWVHDGGVQTLTVPREVTYDPVQQTLLKFPVKELASLRGIVLGNHTKGTTLNAATPLSIFAPGANSTTFDIEAEIALHPQAFAFGMSVMASGVQAAEVVIQISVGVSTQGSRGSSSGGLRQVNVTTKVPHTKAGYNSAFSFSIPGDASTLGLRVLGDRAIVEVFVAGGRGVASVSVLAPGADYTKSRAFIFAGNGTAGSDSTVVVSSAMAWEMGCGWAQYP